MPLDAVFLHALNLEFQEKLQDSKIYKIHQPDKDSVIFVLRGQSGVHKLLFSITGGSPRLHLTTQSFENPLVPPMFCMLLRKHLQGGRLLSITQIPMERVLEITVGVYDELGDFVSRRLIFELMGAGANLILVGADGRITDCLRRSHGEKRPILPGLFYREPVAQEKRNLLALSPESLAALIEKAPPDGEIAKWAQGQFLGISPLIAREIAHESAGEPDARFGDLKSRGDVERALLHLARRISENSFSPQLLLEGQRPLDISYMPIAQYGGAVTLVAGSDFSSLLENFHMRRRSGENQKAKALIKTVEALRDRIVRKIAIQQQELLAAGDRDRLRQMGDIITANVYRLKKGMPSFRAENFYDPDGGEIEIKLDTQKTPQQNAAKYYKDYTRAKTAQEMLTKQIQKGELERDYLESVLFLLSRTETERDVLEIRQELMDGQFIKGQRAEKKQKRITQEPHSFRSSAGFPIFVGKNNVQNDKLTLKTARGDDIWLHTQKIHGSHVIISAGGRMPDEKTILEAAQLAAYYSQGRMGTNVPVDYTQVRYVKKPAGAKPGMVIYSNHKTLYVTPAEGMETKD